MDFSIIESLTDEELNELYDDSVMREGNMYIGDCTCINGPCTSNDRRSGCTGDCNSGTLEYCYYICIKAGCDVIDNMAPFVIYNTCFYGYHGVGDFYHCNPYAYYLIKR